MNATAPGIGRPGRCLGCRGKIKVDAGGALVNCPLCGLTLVRLPGMRSLPPLAAPRAGRDACWKSLAEERRLPAGPGAAAIRQARLLLVPYWRRVDEATRSVSRPGRVVSGADLLPVGLPRLTAERTRIAGLDVEPGTRVGDAMGRLEDPASLRDAVVVDVTLGPEGESQQQTIAALASEPIEGGSGWWQLVYYPVWSFHYVVYDKESFHVVDAVTARPVGPARRVRAPRVATAAAVPMAAIFLAFFPLLGAAAALPAWLGALAGQRLMLRAQRNG